VVAKGSNKPTALCIRAMGARVAAGVVMVFVTTNPFKAEDRQYAALAHNRMVPALSTRTSSSMTVVRSRPRLFEHIEVVITEPARNSFFDKVGVVP
jgi:hypothetical protein